MLVRLEQISLELSGKSILTKIDLQVAVGQIVTLIGPNGAGKTSLLRILLKLQTPSSGLVWHKPGLKIGYTPQGLNINHLLPISVKRFLSLSGPVELRALEAVCAQVGLKAQHLDAALSNVSGGELQRILLAKALLRKPDLLILDEPTQGVDLVGQGELYSLITQIAVTQGCGVLLVSHDLHLVMAATNEVLCLNTHICCRGQAQQVRQDPAFVALFGQQAALPMAFYSHQHDHHHDLQGHIHE